MILYIYLLLSVILTVWFIFTDKYWDKDTIRVGLALFILGPAILPFLIILILIGFIIKDVHKK